MRKILPVLLFAVFLLAGAGLLLYPTVSNYVNRINGSQAIQVLAEAVSGTAEEELERQKTLAKRYNLGLLGQSTEETLEYDSILDFGNGIMGYLEIPDIQVSLPIYHGVEEEILSRGLGHMPQSAFPIGGEGNHAAIVGHTGLPSAKMLDDLVKLETGDSFRITVMGECLHYCVDQILVVEPADSQGLAPVRGKDYCTLVTCTPYGVNSHRLLVRGVRTEKVQETFSVQQTQPIWRVDGIWWFSVICALAFGVLAAAALLLRMKRR